MNELTVAVVQLQATLDRSGNLACAQRLLDEAAERRARLVVLPELFNRYGPLDEVSAAAESLDGPTVAWLTEQARRLECDLIGSLALRGEGLVHNATLHVTSQGEIAGIYRKIHLFDVAAGEGASATESRHIAPGAELLVTSVERYRVGHAICFDLRFPRQFAELRRRQAELLAVPAAFTRRTGAAHWHLLVRGRAIESQTFVLAANQCGATAGTTPSFGHSLIVDPWGEILGEGPADGEAVVTATLDLARVAEVRRMLPLRSPLDA